MAQLKLLVADDSLTIQKVIRLALGSENYQIQTVSDGAQALEQITTFRPDIVLIDVSLAKKSAFEVKNEVNTHPDLAHIKFVLMSSAFKQVDESQATSAGFDARLIKPFDPAHLRNIISSTLGSTSSAETSSPAPSSHSKRNEVGFGDFLSHMNHPPADEFGADPKPLAADSDHEEVEEVKSNPKHSNANRNEVGFGDFLSHMNHPPADEFGADPKPLSADSTHDDEEVSPPEGMSDDLWKTDTGIPAQSGSGDDDIRKLTESTLKMSGFTDDSGWSVQEKKAPSSHQSNDLGFQFTMPDMNSSKPDPTLEPHKQHFDFQSSWSESAASDFSPNTSFDEPHERHEQPRQIPEETKPARKFTPAPTASTESALSLDPEALERIIQKEVSSALEKVLKNMLPDIAERVIKEEIHKMLSHPPKSL